MKIIVMLRMPNGWRETSYMCSHFTRGVEDLNLRLPRTNLVGPLDCKTITLTAQPYRLRKSSLLGLLSKAS